MYKYDKKRKEFCTFRNAETCSEVRFTHFMHDGEWRIWVQIGLHFANIDLKKRQLMHLKKWVDYELGRLNK